MIEAIFLFGADIILIRINEHHVEFGNTSYGARLATIDGIKLSRSGVEKEFPDLLGREDWKQEAINRFKENIKSLKGEKTILKYIKEDLEKHGYVLKRWKQNGYREVKA